MIVELEINNTMGKFTSNLIELLGDNLLSVILYGSAVLGDFVPGKGDLDFLVVTKESLNDGDCEKLFNLHDRMRAGEMGQLAIQNEGIKKVYKLSVDVLSKDTPSHLNSQIYQNAFVNIRTFFANVYKFLLENKVLIKPENPSTSTKGMYYGPKSHREFSEILLTIW